MKILVLVVCLFGVVLIIIENFKKSHRTRQLVQDINHNAERNVSFKRKNNNGQIRPVKSENYNRFILLKNTNEDYIINGLKEYGELLGNETYVTYNFQVAQHKDWHVIRVESSISFYDYYNIVTWLSSYKQGTTTPDLCYGFSRNKINSEKDYLFFRDPNNQNGDTQVGTFQNGKNFHIYLPEAFKEFGTLRINHKSTISFNKTVEFLLSHGLNILDIFTPKYKDYKVKMNN